MQDKEQLKKKLLDLIDDCNEQLSKYKELRAKGLSKDEVFETLVYSRKQTISEILDIITLK